MTTDRAALERAIRHARTTWTGTSIAWPLVEAAEAHLATLPRTKPVEVHLVAHMNGDGTAVFFCQPDSAVSRAEIERGIRGFGGQLVELHGVAQVPA